MDDTIAAVRAAYEDAARECHRMAESYTRSLSHYAEDDPEWRKIKYAAAAVTVAAENIMTLARADEVAQPWQPPPEAERPNGYRCLGLVAGIWRSLRWSKDFSCWCYPDNYYHRSSPVTTFAPLPPPPKGGEG